LQSGGQVVSTGLKTALELAILKLENGFVVEESFVVDDAVCCSFGLTLELGGRIAENVFEDLERLLGEPDLKADDSFSELAKVLSYPVSVFDALSQKVEGLLVVALRHLSEPICKVEILLSASLIPDL
jgi:hypothetical protein